MKTLLFVDTNILLDFYRVRDKVRIEFLNQLEKVSDILMRGNLARLAVSQMVSESGRFRIGQYSKSELAPKC